MTHTNGIVRSFSERLPDITGATLRAGRRRASDTSATLTRRGAMKAAAELANNAVAKLLEIAYQVDDTGIPANIDADGRLLIAVPWGRHYQRYGLRANESAVLALHVKRLYESPPVAPLFVYDDSVRSWYINIFDHPSFNQAVSYWRRAQLGSGDYLALLREVQSRRGNG